MVFVYDRMYKKTEKNMLHFFWIFVSAEGSIVYDQC